MVDEVKIKATLDTSGVESGVRDIKSQFKALHYDSKFLGDSVNDFEKAFKRFGGYMPDQAKKAFKTIKTLTDAVSEDETNIAKQSKNWLKNTQKSEKSYKNIGKSLKGLGKIISTGAIVGAVKKAVDIADRAFVQIFFYGCGDFFIYGQLPIILQSKQCDRLNFAFLDNVVPINVIGDFERI